MHETGRMKADIGFALAALLAVLLAQPISRRTGLPSAVLLVVVGAVYGELPGPNITLRPELVLTLVLPPLLYSASLQASLVDIRSNVRTIASLSIGLTLATAFAVGGVLVVVVPGLPVAVAIALGAAVAPPDPVASLSIGRRAGLPPRLITLVEGEGLLNDATALTTYTVAVAAAVGHVFSWPHAIEAFLLESIGGFVIGLASALAVRYVRRWIEDPLVDNALSLGIPFAVYIVADSAHASGVLAVVVCGLVLGHSAGGEVGSGQSRLQSRAVWRLLDFLLEGFVFLLIGQQLPTVLRGLGPYPTHTLVAATVATVLAVLVVRPLWLFTVEWLPGRLRGSDTSLGPKEVAAMSWAGTRGVITLAAAFALPLTAHGQPLPDRDLLLLCAYVVVLVTLVGQGLTFGWVLRRLHLPTDAAAERRNRGEARLAAARAGLARLNELQDDDGASAAVAQRLVLSARQRVDRLERSLERLDGADDMQVDTVAGGIAEVRRLYIDAQRDEIVRWRDAGRLSDRSLRQLDRELDIEESRSSA
jgi:monovalent cation/hydrogen antiporter